MHTGLLILTQLSGLIGLRVVSEYAPVLSSSARFGRVANCTDQTQKHLKLQKYISPTVSFRTKEGSGTANIS
jgi:hypothetical protein